MGLWFLNQTNQLQSSGNDVYESMETEDDFSSDEEDNVSRPPKPSTFGNYVYPPRESSVLIRMCNYLKTCKKIHVAIPKILTSMSIERIPKAVIPIENQCHECSLNLEGPFLLLKNAKVLTMNGILHGYAPFIKICPACQMCYRYQEYNDGVHNFDNNFLLTLDMCLFIRENMKQHVAV